MALNVKMLGAGAAMIVAFALTFWGSKKAKADPGIEPIPVPPAPPGPDPVTTPACPNGVVPGVSMNLATAQAKLNVALDGTGTKLVVDGKYGPATKAAIEKFQKGLGLAINGCVDNATATALAPYIVTSAPPAPTYYTDPNGLAWQISNPYTGVWIGDYAGDPIMQYGGIAPQQKASSYSDVVGRINSYAYSHPVG